MNQKERARLRRAYRNLGLLNRDGSLNQAAFDAFLEAGEREGVVIEGMRHSVICSPSSTAGLP